MKIQKVNDTFDVYKLEVSFVELTAIRGGLAGEAPGVVGDAALQAIDWYLNHLPGPGEEEQDKKKDGEGEGDLAASPVGLPPKEDFDLPPEAGDDSIVTDDTQENPPTDAAIQSELDDLAELPEPTVP